MSYIPMHVWVQNELYQDLLKKPDWVISTFGSLTPGQRMSKEQEHTMVSLIVGQMNKSECPWDRDHRHDWRVGQYIPVFKAALVQANKIKNKQFLSYNI